VKGQVRSLGLHPGWYNEPYRHSLAAKGVSTSFSSKKSKIISELYGVPPHSEIDSMKRKTSDDFHDINLEVAELDGLPEHEEADVLVPLTKKSIDNFEEIELLIDAMRRRHKAKEIFNDEFAGERMNFVSKDEFIDRFTFYNRDLGFNSDETKMALMSEFNLSPGEVEDELQDLGPMRYAYKRKSMATKMDSELAHATGDYDFIGGKGDDPIDFISGNLKSTEDHSLDKWWSSVKYTLLHPFKDADGEWVEYNMLAGHPIHLSDDKMERAEQRGAAIFARVASQANIEPLIERGKNRSFRQVALDLAFGRRTGDEKDDEELIKRYEE